MVYRFLLKGLAFIKLILLRSQQLMMNKVISGALFQELSVIEDIFNLTIKQDANHIIIVAAHTYGSLCSKAVRLISKSYLNFPRL